MPTVYQNPIRPDQTLFAIRDLIESDLHRTRIAVAYATLTGCQTLIDGMEGELGVDAVRSMRKLMVTSFDFGHTQPEALTYWIEQPNSAIRIANVRRVSGNLRLTAGSTNFHPKVYIFDHPRRTATLIGSANLTRRAFSVNTEVAFAQRNTRSRVINDVWTASWESAQELTDELLQEYEAVRPSRPVPLVDPPLPRARRLRTHARQRLVDAIDLGLDPSEFQCFWIQAGSMSSGGSRNQLELPRGANLFFGFNFNTYESRHVTIGFPVLTAHALQWRDRPLTWHAGGGQNAMERLNLPTIAQGGFSYIQTAILFRRAQQGFEISVTPWGSGRANGWVSASVRRGTVFRTGIVANARVCGFF